MPRALKLLTSVLISGGVALALAVWPGLAAQNAPRGGLSPARNSPPDSLAIIVNRSNPVENLSFDELRQYFLGERTRWPNGRRVSIVMRAPEEPERAAVLRIIYEKDEADFHTHILHLKFLGKISEEPRPLGTASRVNNFVFLQPGAISYVRASEVSPSVKVISVDGLMPGSAGYKLKF